MGFHYVYILVAVAEPERHYVGHTFDLKKRLREHNRAKSDFTARFGRWRYETVIAVRDAQIATRLERYLKSGSGREFARRHFGRGEMR